jgi:hypothetical protein
VQELMDERLARMRREASKERESDSATGVPKARPRMTDLTLGGDNWQPSHNFLRRKSILASLFLEPDEYPAFLRLWRTIQQVAGDEASGPVPTTTEARREALQAIISHLQKEIRPADLLQAWTLLAADQFQHLDWVYKETKTLNLVRPSYQEDLDKAYREAKKLLKQLIAEFTDEFPPNPEKKDIILASLNVILDVYTHHHFVLKYHHQSRPAVSRAEFDDIKSDLQTRLDEARREIAALRREGSERTVARDQFEGRARAAEREVQELRERLAKLDPAEVERRLQAMESKLNAVKREQQETLEEDALLRTGLRNLDDENQRLQQRLRELEACPDEDAHDVTDLLHGKRVAIFGGVGRDHYWPLLREAGVTEEDYEWYEGYRTISQGRTTDIVNRCDVVVVVTSYAGHMMLWQTRSSVGPNQHLFLIHSSGAGSLRQRIVETFRKRQS